MENSHEFLVIQFLCFSCGLEVPQSIMQHKMKLKHKSEIHIIFNLTIECQQPTAIHEEVHTP
jgi:hypothetical protein